MEAYLKASEVSADRVEDIRNHLKEGDTVKAVIINVDRKNRGINLSIKAHGQGGYGSGDAEVRCGKHQHCRYDQSGCVAQGQDWIPARLTRNN